MNPMTHAVHDSPTGFEGATICSACEDYAICMLRRRNRRPVLFCEEFKPAADTRRRMEIPSSEPRGVDEIQPERRSGRHRSAYSGLCRSCTKLPNCHFTKPGGGTWHCLAYERME